MPRQIASHNDYVAMQALVEAGHSPYEAAQQIGLPLGAFKSKNADPTWYEQIVERWETVRVAKVDQRIGELVQKDDPSPGIVTAWAKANHPDYREKVEVTGKDGGPLEVRQAEIAAAIDRFTGTVLRLAAARDEGQPALGPGRADEGSPGLPVGGVVGEAESASASG